MSTTIRAPGRVVTVGEACLRRNPDLFRKLDPEAMHILNSTPLGNPKKKRIRQKTKGPNKTELAAMDYLRAKWPWMRFRFHALTFVLANGVKYTPDIIGFNKNPHITTLSCVEVKGKQMWDDAVVKVKVAAHEWPNANWGLLWRENGEWHDQIVLP